MGVPLISEQAYELDRLCPPPHCMTSWLILLVGYEIHGDREMGGSDDGNAGEYEWRKLFRRVMAVERNLLFGVGRQRIKH
jgi:hypothetical protein